MRAVNKAYWTRAVVLSALAFLVGATTYVLIGIVAAQAPVNVGAAWQEIRVQSKTCNCVLKFQPEQPLAGHGMVGDSYVTYNADFNLVVGVNGIGTITIEDGDGNVVYSFYQATSTYTETIVPVALSDGVGMYILSVALDGLTKVGPGIQAKIYVDYRALPVPIPEVPNTGGLYWQLGGYAVPTFGVMGAGVLFAVIVFGLFVIVAMKRQKQEARNTRGKAAFGKAMRREVSGGKIEKAGIGKKRKRIDKISMILWFLIVVGVTGAGGLYVGERAGAASDSDSAAVNVVSTSYLALDYTPEDAGNDDPAYIMVDPSINGGVGTGAATLTVTTGNATGSNVTVKMYNNDVNLNYLVSSVYTEYLSGGTVLDTSKNVVAPVGAGASSLAENTWGYYVGTPGTIAWNPVPVATGTAAGVFSTNSAGIDSELITFGIRAGYNLPSAGGTKYTNIVRFTVTDNAP